MSHRTRAQVIADLRAAMKDRPLTLTELCRLERALVWEKAKQEREARAEARRQARWGQPRRLPGSSMPRSIRAAKMQRVLDSVPRPFCQNLERCTVIDLRQMHCGMCDRARRRAIKEDL